MPAAPAATGRRWRVTAGAGILLALLSACAPSSGSSPSPDPLLLGAGTTQARELLDRKTGTPVVVNLWASWCAPCRDEAPTLAQAASKYEGRVRFVGVDYQDSPDKAREFMEAFDLPFPSVEDRDGRVSSALGLRGIPVTVIFDERGTEVFRRVGVVTQSELVAALEDVLTP